MSAADGHAARGNPRTGYGKSRSVQRGRQTAEIRKAGSETQTLNPVLRGDETVDPRLHRTARVIRHTGKIGAVKMNRYFAATFRRPAIETSRSRIGDQPPFREPRCPVDRIWDGREIQQEAIKRRYNLPQSLGREPLNALNKILNGLRAGMSYRF